MLIEGGYAHSLKALLEKNRAEEEQLAASRARGDSREAACAVSMIDWALRLWMRFEAGHSHWIATRSPARIER